MSEPHRTRGRRARTDEQLVQRVLFDATWRFAWRALARYHLDDADRDDIAQEAVITAWRYRGRYRAERGNPEQWLSRIVRNAAIDFLSARREGLVTTDALAGVPSEDLPLEERMSMREVADLVFAVLPDDERRAVIALAIEGLTLREAAAVEGVSPSTMHDRYERGVAALRAAVSRGEDRKLFSIPFPAGAPGDPAGDAHADEADPPPEMVEQAWQRFVAEGGLGGAPDSEPPASGAERLEPEAPPSSRPRGSVAKLLRLLGPTGGALIGATVASLPARSVSPDPATMLAQPVHEEASAAATAEPLAAPLATDPSPVPAASTAAVPPVRRPRARAPRPAIRERHDDESALVEGARVALVHGDAAGALVMLGRHAQLYPRGVHAGLRDALVADACSALPKDRRCAAPPRP